MTPLRRLMTTLDRACPLGQIRGGVVTSNGHSALVGLATESDSHRYQWDGLRRGGNPASPFLTIQYTLDGWGSFTQDGTTQRVGPGQAFIATTPGPYRYGLPPDAPPWTFAWMLFYLPYAIARLDREAGERGRVVSLPPDGPALGAFARLFLTVARSTGRMDPWEFERQVLDLTLHWSRHLAQVEAHAGPDLTAQLDNEYPIAGPIADGHDRSRSFPYPCTVLPSPSSPLQPFRRWNPCWSPILMVASVPRSWQRTASSATACSPTEPKS